VVFCGIGTDILEVFRDQILGTC